MSSDPGPCANLGEYLTAREAKALAVQLEAGRHITKALQVVDASRRPRAQRLLAAARLDHTSPQVACQVLRAIAGAKAVRRDALPVWTMPAAAAATGHLTSEFHRLVAAAKQSVTCATYNFNDTSQMWTALRDASERPGVAVTVYVDSGTTDAAKVVAQLPRATIYQSAELDDGTRIVSHAKFVIIDHEMVLLTSANFSYSAENRNIELGLLIHESGLAASIEHTMAAHHGSLYEVVPSGL